VEEELKEGDVPSQEEETMTTSEEPLSITANIVEES
jgi:hypothetical protein